MSRLEKRLHDELRAMAPIQFNAIGMAQVRDKVKEILMDELDPPNNNGTVCELLAANAVVEWANDPDSFIFNIIHRN